MRVEVRMLSMIGLSKEKLYQEIGPPNRIFKTFSDLPPPYTDVYRHVKETFDPKIFKETLLYIHNTPLFLPLLCYVYIDYNDQVKCIVFRGT